MWTPPAEPSSIRKSVPATVNSYRADVRDSLLDGLAAVLEVAIPRAGHSDIRRGILTAVYNYDTEEFEIRWDLAK